jgi:radical SAM superfamily enzyme YgiQ (UPF0313 family)
MDCSKGERFVASSSSFPSGEFRVRKHTPEKERTRSICKEERRRILEMERGSVIKRGSFPLEVALVYPNTYEVGTSNLGFQYIYHLFNSFEEVRCERFYWDPGLLWSFNEQPVSLEGERNLASFSLVAFSVSFEDDYSNIIRTLIAGGFQPEAEKRGDGFPVLLAGGPCAFMNPEPLATVIDLFALGDGEKLIPTVVERWLEVISGSDGGKNDFLEAMGGEEGFYVPRFLEVKCSDDGKVGSFSYLGKRGWRVKRVWSDRCGENSPRILSPQSHFAEMPLVEVGTGCGRGCRFCAASFIYRPPRKRTVDEVKRDIDRLFPTGNGKIGLIGSALSDYPGLIKILEHIANMGGTVGLSSFRLDGINDSVVELLSRLNVKTLTCAPEAGSHRMREIIRKSLDEDEILESIAVIGRSEIVSLKLYFMIGLPFEIDEDIEAIVCLVKKIKGILRHHRSVTKISLKINPFIPKPFTPFQWSPLEREESLRIKIDFLSKKFRKVNGITMKVGSIRKAVNQAILSRGDRRLSNCLIDAARGGSSLKTSMRRYGIDSQFYLYRSRSEEEIFPWDFVDHGIEKRWLFKEYQRAGMIASGGFE